MDSVLHNFRKEIKVAFFVCRSVGVGGREKRRNIGTFGGHTWLLCEFVSARSVSALEHL